jgi:hypothetical protein
MKFDDLINNVIEYPNEELLNGIENNTMYRYVSNFFVNGIINYVDIYYAITIKRYVGGCKLNFDTTITNELDQQGRYHTEYNKLSDDVLVLAGTENELWMFWSDRDVSDCKIFRTNKDITKEQFKKLFINWIKEKGYDHYYELPIPNGWCKI